MIEGLQLVIKRQRPYTTPEFEPTIEDLHLVIRRAYIDGVLSLVVVPIRPPSHRLGEAR